MNFEDLLNEAGSFGRFQILTLLLLCLPRIFLPLHFLLHNFLAAIPPHHCAIPHQDQFANLTEEEMLLISIPRDSEETFSSCTMFSEPQFHLLRGATQGSANATSIQSCQYGWVYDKSQFTSTIVTQWDLVCEQRSLNQATATFFFIGVMAGAVIFGDLSDRFGRKTMLQVSYVCTLIFGMASSASVSYTMLAVTRTLTGASICGLSIIVVPLGLEWVDIQHRTVSGILTGIFWSVGNMLLALIAYLVRDWRWLLFSTTLPCVIGIISTRWLPESARWLLGKGKVKQAYRHLKACARMNGRKQFAAKINLEILTKAAAAAGAGKSGKSYTYITLFRTLMLRKISFCMGAVWFGVAFSYYGLSLNITGFGLGIYMTQFVFGIIEIPAKLMVFFVVNRFGRKWTQAWTLILTGLCIGANIVIPTSLDVLRFVVAMTGKGFSEAAFTTVFLYSSELFPTVLRQNGQGYCTFLARLGGSVAPLIFLLDILWKPLPQVTYCGIAVLCGSAAFFLPETLNAQLPETIEDIEKCSSERKKKLHSNVSEVMPLQSL